MPCLQEQDANKVAGRYGAQKLPVVLSEMQKGDANRCKATEYIRYQSAGRTDAEPITRKLKCGYRLCFYSPNEQYQIDIVATRRYRYVCLLYNTTRIIRKARPHVKPAAK